MCKKASRQVNALKRISKFLTQDSRKLIYRSFIAANFNYCPISWMFCGNKNTSMLEKLQERAHRLVFCFDQNLSYDDLLKRGDFLSLKAYRIKCLAVEVFKCVHGFNPTYLDGLFTEPLANYNFTDRRRLKQSKLHTYTYGFRSFRYSGSKLWKSLPRAIKNTNDNNLTFSLNWKDHQKQSRCIFISMHIHLQLYVWLESSCKGLFIPGQCILILLVCGA